MNKIYRVNIYDTFKKRHMIQYVSKIYKIDQ